MIILYKQYNIRNIQLYCIVHLFAVNSFTKLHIYVVGNKNKIARNMYTNKEVPLEKINDLYCTVQKRIGSIGLEKSPESTVKGDEKSILTR